MPNVEQARNNLDLVIELTKYVPHLLKEEKRRLVHQTLNFTKRIRLPKDYPFKNGQQTTTKGSIVWTDYSIQTWPLLLQLLGTSSNSFEQIFNEFFDQNKQFLPDLMAIKQQLANNLNETKPVCMDELDRWYDEISTTLIKPQAYHLLYAWFGNDLHQIGYDAFDYFMEERDSLIAWQKAILSHLSNISNLPAEQREFLMNKHFNNLF
jgi:hypothetical protein